MRYMTCGRLEMALMNVNNKPKYYDSMVNSSVGMHDWDTNMTTHKFRKPYKNVHKLVETVGTCKLCGNCTENLCNSQLPTSSIIQCTICDYLETFFTVQRSPQSLGSAWYCSYSCIPHYIVFLTFHNYTFPRYIRNYSTV